MKILANRTTTGVSTWMFWRWMEIDGRRPGVKYLTRLYVIQTPWFGVKLHWFHAPDPDDHCHDHPWWFWSLLLRGRYTEHRQFLGPLNLLVSQEIRERRTGSLVFRPATAVHRIIATKPGTVTLILNGPRTKSWYFWRRVSNVSDLFQPIPWRTYLKIPPSTPEV